MWKLPGGKGPRTVFPHSIENSLIDFTSCHSDLGVCVDRTLKFHAHISRNAGILNDVTNYFLSCTQSIDADFIVNIYFSYICSTLEYGSCL